MQPRIKNLNRHIILKKLASILVLCTFLLSITPKQILHNFSADHTDKPSKKLSGKLEYSQVGFNCDCNSVVATSPFTESSLAFEIPKLVHVAFYRENFSVSLLSNEHFYFSLRGPPAIA